MSDEDLKVELERLKAELATSGAARVEPTPVGTRNDNAPVAKKPKKPDQPAKHTFDAKPPPARKKKKEIE